MILIEPYRRVLSKLHHVFDIIWISLFELSPLLKVNVFAFSSIQLNRSKFSLCFMYMWSMWRIRHLNSSKYALFRRKSCVLLSSSHLLKDPNSTISNGAAYQNWINIYLCQFFPSNHSMDKVVVDDGDIKPVSPVCISFRSIRMRAHEQRKAAESRARCEKKIWFWVFFFVAVAISLHPLTLCSVSFFSLSRLIREKEILVLRQWQKFAVVSRVIRLFIIILN